MLRCVLYKQLGLTRVSNSQSHPWPSFSARAPFLWRKAGESKEKGKMEQTAESSQNVEIFKAKKLIKALESARG